MGETSGSPHEQCPGVFKNNDGASCHSSYVRVFVGPGHLHVEKTHRCLKPTVRLRTARQALSQARPLRWPCPGSRSLPVTPLSPERVETVQTQQGCPETWSHTANEDPARFVLFHLSAPGGLAGEFHFAFSKNNHCERSIHSLCHFYVSFFASY